MLPSAHRQPYEKLQQDLQHLKQVVEQSNLNGPMLQSAFLEVQQFFQLHIVSLEFEEKDTLAESHIQSYQTEINKQLRLLGMDVMFLQAARQSATAQQRQAQMGDRLDLVIRYCQTLLEE